MSTQSKDLFTRANFRSLHHTARQQHAAGVDLALKDAINSELLQAAGLALLMAKRSRGEFASLLAQTEPQPEPPEVAALAPKPRAPRTEKRQRKPGGK